MGFKCRLAVFISSFATYAVSFSVHQTYTKPDDFNVSIRKETPAMNRRSCLSSLLSGCGLALTVGDRAACAQQETSPPCMTGCMYECPARAMERKYRSMSKDRLMQECKEQCGERATCQGIPPQRKQEPVLIQPKRIQGLYPRWQDDF